MAEFRAIPVGDGNLDRAREVALCKGGSLQSRGAQKACLECIRKEGGWLTVDELLKQQACQITGEMPKDQLAASFILEREALLHSASCDNPTEERKHLHEPIAAEVIITDRDSKPRKGSLHRQRCQRIAAFRRELLLAFFDVFEKQTVQRDSQMKKHEIRIPS